MNDRKEGKKKSEFKIIIVTSYKDTIIDIIRPQFIGPLDFSHRPFYGKILWETVFLP
jgi:hypothetical protein